MIYYMVVRIKRGEDSSSVLLDSSWTRFNGSALQAACLNGFTVQRSPLIRGAVLEIAKTSSRNIFVNMEDIVWNYEL